MSQSSSPANANATASAGAREPAERSIDPHHPTLFWRVMRVPARLCSTLLGRMKVYGRHHVPHRGGVLLVANHQSYLDPVLLAVYLRRPMSYLAKSELFRNKFLGWLIRSLNAFPVKQGAGDVGAVRETIRRLREGHMLSIFPEGARTLTGEMNPIQPGAALVVKRAGVPIVPVVLEGSFDAWPKGHRIFRPRPVSVMYGPPMKVEGLDAREITQLIDRTLRTMFAELRAIHRRRVREEF